MISYRCCFVDFVFSFRDGHSVSRRGVFNSIRIQSDGVRLNGIYFGWPVLSRLDILRRFSGGSVCLRAQSSGVINGDVVAWLLLLLNLSWLIEAFLIPFLRHLGSQVRLHLDCFQAFQQPLFQNLYQNRLSRISWNGWCGIVSAGDEGSLVMAELNAFLFVERCTSEYKSMSTVAKTLLNRHGANLRSGEGESESLY